MPYVTISFHLLIHNDKEINSLVVVSDTGSPVIAVTKAWVPRVPRLDVGVLWVTIVEVGVCMVAVTSDGVP